MSNEISESFPDPIDIVSDRIGQIEPALGHVAEADDLERADDALLDDDPDEDPTRQLHKLGKQLIDIVADGLSAKPPDTDNPDAVLTDRRFEAEPGPVQRSKKTDRPVRHGKVRPPKLSTEASDDEPVFDNNTDRRVRIFKAALHTYINDPRVIQAMERLPNGKMPKIDADDSLSRYLKELRRYDLLKDGDETRLFQTIEKGISAHNQHGISPESQPELINLVIARQTILAANLRLVIRYAQKISGNNPIFMTDYIQEGNIGLTKAIERFDYRRGHKFATYAIFWIKQSMQRALYDKGRIIRIPGHLHYQFTRIAHATEKLNRQLDREPTEIEIADATGLTVKAIVRSRNYFKIEPKSLNVPIKDGSDTELVNFISDPTDSIEQTTQSLEDEAYISKIFGKSGLGLREKYILSLRLGFEVKELRGSSLTIGDQKLSYEELVDHMSNKGSCTLKETGQMLGLTRERIRQIQAVGLKKIRKVFFKNA